MSRDSQIGAKLGILGWKTHTVCSEIVFLRPAFANELVKIRTRVDVAVPGRYILKDFGCSKDAFWRQTYGRILWRRLWLRRRRYCCCWLRRWRWLWRRRAFGHGYGGYEIKHEEGTIGSIPAK